MPSRLRERVFKMAQGSRAPSARLSWTFTAPVWFTIAWLIAGLALSAANTWLVQTDPEYWFKLFITLISVGGVAAILFLLLSFFRGYFLILSCILALSTVSFWYGFSIISRIADGIAFNF